ncbi:hypothetical protein L21SP5_01952 [Salinivirga cyanobacteriivorans]|uniref:DUF6922 domain-containing protein n=1 Tax=Salinivirga cyanobacteriivorans TaxID=1307839 RepID=A0A0S2I002_9BACT|nr:hypothetical protein [Salinivirga cyanobacteriivorans]ALO15591.1 hypothetical protein L21SP5_01952 [Salinivirga cyanobacteriivorans]
MDKRNISPKDFSPHLFWDVDAEKLDMLENKRIIIERVFTMGDLKDLKLLFLFYSKADIIQELKNAGSLDKKTLNFASFFFNLPKSDFKCYRKTQSNQAHWNY